MDTAGVYFVWSGSFVDPVDCTTDPHNILFLSHVICLFIHVLKVQLLLKIYVHGRDSFTAGTQSIITVFPVDLMLTKLHSINNLRTFVCIWYRLWNNHKIQFCTSEHEWESRSIETFSGSPSNFFISSHNLLPIINNHTSHKCNTFQCADSLWKLHLIKQLYTGPVGVR